jgi:voltage-gated potassium channel Kch
MRLIIVATVVTTVAGGLLVYAFDRKDFANLGDAFWWSIQTVTTVGYGDVTPSSSSASLRRSTSSCEGPTRKH